MPDERYDEMARDMHADIMADAPKCACCECPNPAGNCNAEDSYGRLVAVCEDCKRDLLTGRAKLRSFEIVS